LFRRRTFLLLALSLGLLVVARPTPAAFWAGLPLVALGEAIRVWAAGYLTKLSGLVTAGPFAMCRNPLYIGSFLISLGYLVMCSRVDVLVVGIVLFWILHGGAVAYEERLLREKFGEEFEQYCRQAPRFLPRPGRFSGSGVFSFEQVMANDEHRQAASAAILSAAFAFMAYGSFSVIDWLSGLV
jgi:protein-S-isoprenylcysteine O-methyltransferase Ste14